MCIAISAVEYLPSFFPKSVEKIFLSFFSKVSKQGCESVTIQIDLSFSVIKASLSHASSFVGTERGTPTKPPTIAAQKFSTNCFWLLQRIIRTSPAFAPNLRRFAARSLEASSRSL